MHILSTPIDYLKGVGPLRADLLKKELGIFTYNDLLQHYPFRYIDKSKFHKISELFFNRLHPQFFIWTSHFFVVSVDREWVGRVG